MVKLSYSPYELQPKSALNAVTENQVRKGFLVRCDWQGQIGFADVCSWPVFGDPTRDELIEDLKKGRIDHPLLQQALWFCRRTSGFDSDSWAEARDKVASMKSHRLITDLSKAPDLSQTPFAKVKMGRDLKLETHALLQLAEAYPKTKWRLDFNSSMKPDDFEAWALSLGGIKSQIDYIEDPSPYNSRQWVDWQKRFQVSLALDMTPDEEPHGGFDVLVVKPAKQGLSDVEWIVRRHPGLRVVGTTYLGHPLTDLLSAYFMATLYSEFEMEAEVGGYYSGHQFEPQQGFPALGFEKGCLKPQPGMHWGYGGVLENIPWIAAGEIDRLSHG